VCSGVFSFLILFFHSEEYWQFTYAVLQAVSQLSLLDISYFMVEVAFAIQTTDSEKQKKKTVVTEGT
jgi:hypothetical protein